MNIPKAGDTLLDRSALTLRAGTTEGRSILVDRWGVFYVPDEQNRLEYVGTNPLRAEAIFLSPQFALGGEG